MRTLFTNADILAWENDAFKTIRGGCLGVDGDTICYIGTEKPAEAYDAVRDMTGRALMPGLVNCHGHSAMTLLRGVGSGLPLDRWLFDVIIPTEDRFTPDDYRAGYELAMMEMIASGTTSFTDMYMLPSILIELNERVGMKLSAGRVIQSFDPNETAATSPRIPEAIDLFERYHDTQSGRVRIDFQVHAEYTTNDAVTRGFADVCRKYLPRGAHMQIHLSETKKEHDACVEKRGVTPAEWCAEMGLFDFPCLAAHCVWVTESDMELMRRAGVSPVHNPSSNMKLGSGFAPVPEMIARGLNVTLGTDGCASNNNLNMFEEMHLTSVIHNGYHHDPTLMAPETILRMATVNGARAQGRADTGCLEVGKKADIIAVDFRNKAHLYPAFDLPDILVYSAQAADVCMTMADGRVLYEDGRFMTLDVAEVLKNAQAAVKRVYGK